LAVSATFSSLEGRGLNPDSPLQKLAGREGPPFFVSIAGGLIFRDAAGGGWR
jgi:hypothetical protein